MAPAKCLIAMSITLLALSATAHAELFKWVDAQGRVQYTDRLPQDAVNRGNTQLSKQGLAKNVTEPVLTAEQRRAIDERIARQREAEKLERDKKLQENALLSSYSSEMDIDVARRRNLAIVGASILSAEARIKALERRTAAIEREKLFYEKKPFPEKLKRELASVQSEVPKQYAIISQRNEDALEINRRYEAQRQQFVDIKTRLASESQAAKR